LNFDLELPKDSIFNFVFNFVDEGNFKMLRLDNRKDTRTPNSLLHCTQKYFWKPTLIGDPLFPPESLSMSVAINIDFPNEAFSFTVNGGRHNFKNSKGKVKDLFDEIRPALKIGFFNEIGTVKLSNISLV
jgi:hypothetical protein